MTSQNDLKFKRNQFLKSLSKDTMLIISVLLSVGVIHYYYEKPIVSRNIKLTDAAENKLLERSKSTFIKPNSYFREKSKEPRHENIYRLAKQSVIDDKKSLQLYNDKIEGFYKHVIRENKKL